MVCCPSVDLSGLTTTKTPRFREKIHFSILAGTELISFWVKCPFKNSGNTLAAGGSSVGSVALALTTSPECRLASQVSQVLDAPN